MDAHSVDVRKHVRIYMVVFVSLAALTIVTVSVSTLHLQVPAAIAVALLIATVKGSLVACYFMHLISEKKLIFIVLIFTALFFLVLLLVPVTTEEGMVHVP